MTTPRREEPTPLASELRRANWSRVRDVFEAALTHPAERRPSFVAESCRGEPAIEEEVRSLLAAHAEATGFLETPVLIASGGAPGSDSPADEGPNPNVGRVIGPYVIESCIGHGGMGAVFMAQRADRAFERRVAIKMIRQGLDSADVIRKFQHERQILASLDHPYIAHLTTAAPPTMACHTW